MKKFQIEAVDPDIIFVSSLPPKKLGIFKQTGKLGIAALLIIRNLTATDVQDAGVDAKGAWDLSVNG